MTAVALGDAVVGAFGAVEGRAVAGGVATDRPAVAAAVAATVAAEAVAVVPVPVATAGDDVHATSNASEALDSAPGRANRGMGRSLRPVHRARRAPPAYR
jgi:hypothetical protein